MLGPRSWFSTLGPVPTLVLLVTLKALVKLFVFTLVSLFVVVVVGVAANRVNSSSTIFTFKTELASTNAVNLRCQYDWQYGFSVSCPTK